MSGQADSPRRAPLARVRHGPCWPESVEFGAEDSFGVVKQAAVLVILFQKPGDDKLSVLLTTRAKTLRQVLISPSLLIANGQAASQPDCR